LGWSDNRRGVAAESETMSAHEHTPSVQDHADAWHHHEPTEGQPQREHTGDINTWLITQWFVGIVVFVIGLIVVVCIYFDSTAHQMRAARVETTLTSKVANGMKVQAEIKLGINGNIPTYSWADVKAGTVQLPLEQGMQQVLKNYSDGK